MRFDDRVTVALRALARPIAAYRSSVAAASERVHALLSAGGVGRTTLELGTFAAGRIDAARFAELTGGTALDADARARLTRAGDVLRERATADDEAFVVVVERDESLPLAISAALARLGSAFGAVRAVEAIRIGRYEPAQHDGLLASFPYSRWSAAERRVAPPLIVIADGATLRGEGIAVYLDGATRIVLVVRGTCAPAALVRLITPATFVAQTPDAAPVDRLSAYDGPGVVALVEPEAESVAHFSHDPERGHALWQRLTIQRRPAVESMRALNGVSRQQQRDELAQLLALAERPAFSETAIESLAPSGSGDPTERLAAWLLEQSGYDAGTTR